MWDRKAAGYSETDKFIKSMRFKIEKSFAVSFIKCSVVVIGGVYPVTRGTGRSFDKIWLQIWKNTSCSSRCIALTYFKNFLGCFFIVFKSFCAAWNINKTKYSPLECSPYERKKNKSLKVECVKRLLKALTLLYKLLTPSLHC